MTLYLANVSLGICLAWAMYRLLLQNRAAAKTNRWFLLGGFILPFVLPLLPLSSGMVSAANPILLPTITVNDAIAAITPQPSAKTWLTWVYAGGVLAMAAYHLSSIIAFFKIIRGAQKKAGTTNVYLLNKQPMPFSFFGKIFLPENLPQGQQEVIITHEQWHIRQGHSADVLLGMLVQTVLWFLPVIPFYIRDLRKEHEFEVDQLVLTNTPYAPYAETLLQLSLMPIKSAQFHSFSHSQLKNRIAMMTKKQKQNTWKLVMLIPLSCSIVYLHACNKQADIEPIAPKTMGLNEVDSPPQFDNLKSTGTSEEKMIAFTQGIARHIQANLRYPESAKLAGAEGKVFVQFVIDENGQLTGLEVVQNTIENQSAEVVATMEQAARDVFSNLPKLIPAQKAGKAVPVQFVLPINFALQASESSAGSFIGPKQEVATVTANGC